MNIDRDRMQAGPLNTPHRNPNQPVPISLSPEELKEWRTCVQWGFIKFGLPCAIGLHFFSCYMKGGKYNFTASHIPMFFFNILIGGFIYAPSCYSKLQSLYSNKQLQVLKQKEQESMFGLKFEGDTTQTEDVGFQSKLDPNLDGPETNFSHLDMGYDSAYGDKLIMEDISDEKFKQQVYTTTYEDLRRQNRESHASSPMSFPSVARRETRLGDSPGPVAQKSEFEPLVPPKKVIKNKYGDEMES